MAHRCPTLAPTRNVTANQHVPPPKASYIPSQTPIVILSRHLVLRAPKRRYSETSTTYPCEPPATCAVKDPLMALLHQIYLFADDEALLEKALQRVPLLRPPFQLPDAPNQRSPEVQPNVKLLLSLVHTFCLLVPVLPVPYFRYWYSRYCCLSHPPHLHNFESLSHLTPVLTGPYPISRLHTSPGRYYSLN